jgi:prolyl-tRNA synthetase
MLGIPTARIVKTLVAHAIWLGTQGGEGRSEPLVALMRGDCQVNLVKLGNYLESHEVRPATDEEVVAVTGTAPGFVGPFTLPAGVRVIADESVRALTNFSTGAGETDTHWVDANWGADFVPTEWADIRLAQSGETCARCGAGLLKETKGIEVGNTFKLGTKYSQAMNATYTDAQGEAHPFVMGCYGIGVTRTAQAAVEALHDEHGIKWPVAIAPYHLVVIPANPQDPELMGAATDLYRACQAAGVETVLDDRAERAGVKFKDADLIGFPLRITVGKALKDGKVELKARQTGAMSEIPLSGAAEHVRRVVAGIAAPVPAAI